MFPPSDLPTQLQALWMRAFSDGEECALKGGFMEQNPYDLWEPLHDPWHFGWLSGVDQTPISSLSSYRSKDFEREKKSWENRLRRFREHCKSQLSGDLKC